GKSRKILLPIEHFRPPSDHVSRWQRINASSQSIKRYWCNPPSQTEKQRCKAATPDFWREGCRATLLAVLSRAGIVLAGVLDHGVLQPVPNVVHTTCGLSQPVKPQARSFRGIPRSRWWRTHRAGSARAG